MCGTTRRKAAKAASKSMANLDETDIVIVACRHVIAQNVINMFRGEMYVCTYVGIKSLYKLCFLNRYSYSHYLYEKVFAPCGVQWLWEDIGHNANLHCFHSLGLWTWSQHFQWYIQSTFLALSGLHAGAGAGEDMEQFFPTCHIWVHPQRIWVQQVKACDVHVDIFLFPIRNKFKMQFWC